LASRAQEQNELRQPPICSAATASTFQPPSACVVQRRSDASDGNVVKANLTARRAGGSDPSLGLQVAGYRVKTEAYNDRYLTPVIQAMPGDAVAAHLENALEARQHVVQMHGPENPTNLHYFHGGIVSRGIRGHHLRTINQRGRTGPIWATGITFTSTYRNCSQAAIRTPSTSMCRFPGEAGHLMGGCWRNRNRLSIRQA